MEMRRVFFLLCLLVFTKAEVGVSQNKFTAEQQNELDSLNQIINTTAEDTTKVNSLLELANYYYLNNLDTTIIICQTAEKIAEKTDYKRGLSTSYAWLGYLLNKRGDLEKTMEYNFKSLELTQEIGDKVQESSILNNIGFVYHYQGNIPEALKYFISSMKIREEIGDKSGLATSLNNIASIYKNQGDKEKAIEYYDRSLALFSELSLEGASGIDNKRVQTRILCNAGRLYWDLGDTSKAELYYNESLDLGKEIDDKSGVAIALNHLGELEESKGNLIQAIDLYKQSLMSSNVVNSKREITASTLHLGRVYFALGEYSESEKYATQSLSLSKKLGSPVDIRNASIVLYKTYKETRKIDKSLEMFELHIKMRDSISNEKNKKQALKQGLQYEFEKKEALLQLETEKKEHARTIETEKKEAIDLAEKKRKNAIIIAIAIGLIVVSIFLAFLYRRFKIIKRQKNIITEQKKIVDQQRIIVEQKIQETTDSIGYAKLIQQAVLPPESELKSYFSDAFILFNPKDIVSGDFYWFHPYGDQFLLSLADCTGHGVPGAFMSMIGVNLLDKIVFERKISHPNEVLTDLNDELYNRLKKDEKGAINDGMDLAFCLFDSPNKKLYFSGAHNPIYIIRNGELIEIKGDRIHIGNKHDDQNKSFTNHEFNLETGDNIYLFSDGFADQKGGPKKKKFYYKPFRDLLTQNSMLPFSEQKDILMSAHLDWKKDLEQMDDVSIIGVKI